MDANTLKSNLAQKAFDELTRVGMFGKDADYGPDFANAIVRTVETFATSYGHSGGSAELGADLLDRLLRGESL
jgi:hypothetical protein